jgi:hypothetical protein
LFHQIISAVAVHGDKLPLVEDILINAGFILFINLESDRRILTIFSPLTADPDKLLINVPIPLGCSLV